MANTNSNAKEIQLDGTLWVLVINIIVLLGIPALVWFLAALYPADDWIKDTLLFLPFVWIGYMFKGESVQQNEIGVYLFFGKYLGSTGPGFKLVNRLIMVDKTGVENLQLTFSPIKEERIGRLAQVINLKDITTAGEKDAYWGEEYWKRPIPGETDANGNPITWKQKIISAEYNKRVTLDPTVSMILKPSNLRLIYRNLGGRTYAEKKLELERQLYRIANSTMNREFKKRVYGQLINMMTVGLKMNTKGKILPADPIEDEVNLDIILRNEVEALIDGRTKDSPDGDPNTNLGFVCLVANVPKLNAPKSVHDATNAVQVKKLTNDAEIMGSEKDMIVRSNEGIAEANYMKEVHSAVQESGVDVTDYLKIRANVDMAAGAGKTLITNTSETGGGSANPAVINTALQLELLKLLGESKKSSDKNKPSKKVA